MEVLRSCLGFNGSSWVKQDPVGVLGVLVVFQTMLPDEITKKLSVGKNRQTEYP